MPRGQSARAGERVSETCRCVRGGEPAARSRHCDHRLAVLGGRGLGTTWLAGSVETCHRERTRPAVTTRPRARAVFFDVGGTLIHPWPSVGEIYSRVAARHGIHRNPDELERSFHGSWKALKSRGLTVSRNAWWRQ